MGVGAFKTSVGVRVVVLTVNGVICADPGGRVKESCWNATDTEVEVRVHLFAIWIGVGHTFACGLFVV